MIDGFKPYSSARDSSLPWLGEIPAHWELRRTKTLLVERSEKGFPNEPLLAATQSKGVVRKEEYEARTVLALKDLHLLKLVHVSDFVVSLRSFQGGIEYARERGIISPAYTVLYPPERRHHAYLARLLKSRPYVENLSLFVTGIRQGQNIDYERLSRSYLPLPPLAEQAAIVRFLDHADRRLRRYIRAKQKLIVLLEEQKQAIIHRAVTGQIDVCTGKAYSDYYDSRVEWLGRIPQRWRAVSLGRLTVDRCDGPFGSGLKSSHYTDDGIRVVRLQNIGHGAFNDDDAVYIAPEHYATLGDHSVHSGDLLIAGLGDSHHPAGRACVAPPNICPAMVKADCFRFRLDQAAFLPAFAALQLTATARAAAAVLSTGATRQRTNLQATAGRCVVVPSSSEQARVVGYCTVQKARLAALQQAAGREILLLAAYRTRLFADVITGKLDVRELVAGLPDVDSLAADDMLDGENATVDVSDFESVAV